MRQFKQKGNKNPRKILIQVKTEGRDCLPRADRPLTEPTPQS